MRTVKEIKRELESTLDEQSQSYSKAQYDALETEIQELMKELEEAENNA